MKIERKLKITEHSHSCFQGSLEMLKIAPNPDAAYEICTIFAPDCRYQWTRGSNYSSSPSGSRHQGSFRTYSTSYRSFPEITTEQSSHTSASPSGSFPITDASRREPENFNANLSNYNRYNVHTTPLVPKNTFRRQNEHESAIGESEYDYEEENEEDSDEDEDGNAYNFSHHGPPNITYVLRPTMDTSVRSHTTVHL